MAGQKRTLILTGGKLSMDFAKKYLENENFDEIIAVDNGLMYADLLQLVPTYVVGDFDTVNHDLLLSYQQNKEITFKTYKPEKDATDTQIAFELAIKTGSTEVAVLGATGGRFDHTLANTELLQLLLKHDINGYILDDSNKIYLIDRTHVLKKEEVYGKYISLLPFTEEVSGVTLEGFKYPLENHRMLKGDSLGISNEIVEEKAVIEMKSGIFYVIEAHD